MQNFINLPYPWRSWVGSDADIPNNIPNAFPLLWLCIQYHIYESGSKPVYRISYQRLFFNIAHNNSCYLQRELLSLSLSLPPPFHLRNQNRGKNLHWELHFKKDLVIREGTCWNGNRKNDHEFVEGTEKKAQAVSPHKSPEFRPTLAYSPRHGINRPRWRDGAGWWIFLYLHNVSRPSSHSHRGMWWGLVCLTKPLPRPRTTGLLP